MFKTEFRSNGFSDVVPGKPSVSITLTPEQAEIIKYNKAYIFDESGIQLFSIATNERKQEGDVTLFVVFR